MTNDTAQTERTPASKVVRRMLGLGLDTWNTILLVCLGFVVIAGGIVAVSTYAVVRLQKAETREAKDDLERYKSAQAVKVAVLEGHSEELRAANLALENQAAEAKLEYERLKSQLAGRRLTREQHDIIVAELRDKPSKVSIVRPDDIEASLFAADIAQTLKDAGWQVDESTVVGWSTPAIGLYVFHTSQVSKETAHPLTSALAKAGLTVTIELSASQELKLVIGGKPPPF